MSVTTALGPGHGGREARRRGACDQDDVAGQAVAVDVAADKADPAGADAPARHDALAAHEHLGTFQHLDEVGWRFVGGLGEAQRTRLQQP